MPNAWTSGVSTRPAASKSSKKVTARIDMSEDRAGKGLCPECGKPMTKVFANGILCSCCMKDRIVLPLPDSAAEH